jgi:hypothetical protein
MIVKIKVMKDTEAKSQDLLCLEKVMDISPGITPAGRTSAAFLDRLHVCLISLVKEIALAQMCIYMTMASVTTGINTVKKVYTTIHCL